MVHNANSLLQLPPWGQLSYHSGASRQQTKVLGIHEDRYSGPLWTADLTGGLLDSPPSNPWGSHLRLHSMLLEHMKVQLLNGSWPSFLQWAAEHSGAGCRSRHEGSRAPPGLPWAAVAMAHFSVSGLPNPTPFGLPPEELQARLLWPDAIGLRALSIERPHTCRNQGLRGSFSYRTLPIWVDLQCAMMHPLGSSSFLFRKYYIKLCARNWGQRRIKHNLMGEAGQLIDSYNPGIFQKMCTKDSSKTGW